MFIFLSGPTHYPFPERGVKMENMILCNETTFSNIIIQFLSGLWRTLWPWLSASLTLPAWRRPARLQPGSSLPSQVSNSSTHGLLINWIIIIIYIKFKCIQRLTAILINNQIFKAYSQKRWLFSEKNRFFLPWQVVLWHPLISNCMQLHRLHILISVVVNMILINMMMAIINIAFEEIKEQKDAYTNKFEIVEYIKRSVREITGTE